MGFLGAAPVRGGKRDRKGMREEVGKALRAWQDAVKYFESVQDPELVDFAIYEMEAARRKYMFLLKRAGLAD
ncbi:MAG: DUF2508 family protein [Clostridiaceae bacterium]|nr:YaaL family protein [Eubacteriales bacterium]